MFQFRRFPTYGYFIHRRLTDLHLPGCPIRKSPDISLAYSSPRLIAVNRVLLRLPVPRHSPCALCSLTFSFHYACSLYLPLAFTPTVKLTVYVCAVTGNINCSNGDCEMNYHLAVPPKNLISAKRTHPLPFCRKPTEKTLRKIMRFSFLRYILSFCHSLDNCINYP